MEEHQHKQQGRKGTNNGSSTNNRKKKNKILHTTGRTPAQIKRFKKRGQR